jgi:predicted transposase/invertase (TIGR01784 family)
MKFIDPRIDFAFKKIFGGEDTKDILINFIESLLGLESEKRIKEILILDPFVAPKIKGMKLSVLDVKCKDHRGISYIVEMQVRKAKAFVKRIQYNAAKTYANQIAKGEDYPKLNQVIAVTITNFTLFEGLDRYVSRHATIERETGVEYLSGIIYYVIELSKFEKKVESLDNFLDKWIWFIKYASELEDIPENLKEDVFIHAFKKAAIANMSPEELEYYDKASMAIADQQGALELAREEAKEEGKKEGIEEGRKEGIEEGRKEGIEEGRKKGLESFAKYLLSENKSYEDILKITGFDIQEIKGGK